jgi:3-methyladenine DNA glycosylase AlkD
MCRERPHDAQPTVAQEYRVLGRFIVSAKALVAEIREYCASRANPAGLEKWRRYFKEGFDGWGLLEKDDPLWAEQRPAWAARYRKLGLRGFMTAGNALFASGKYEEGALAVQFVKDYRGEIDGAALARFSGWFEAGIANWAHTDVVCGELLSPALVAGVSLDTIAPWRASPLKYQRRAVPVAMLGLLKHGSKIKPLLDFLRPLMLDSERVVQQGLGWFLREAWKKDPKPVESFLTEWKDRSPRLIFQYATEKMTAAQKDRFRRSR